MVFFLRKGQCYGLEVSGRDENWLGRDQQASFRDLASRYNDASEETVGLRLGEAKTILRRLQRLVIQSQVEEYVECARVCTECDTFREIRDYRTRKLQTLFGTVEISAPRLKGCKCAETFVGRFDYSFSPLTSLLPDRATPELRRMQADLGGRYSYRDAARLMQAFLPCTPQNHATIRNRLGRVAEELETKDHDASEPEQLCFEFPDSADEIAVFMDTAYVRSAPHYQKRSVDVVVGKVEGVASKTRRFGCVVAGSDGPLGSFRGLMHQQGWYAGRPVTVFSDGEAALPNLVKAALNQSVTHILDWWHISMRVRYIENAFKGIIAGAVDLSEEQRGIASLVDRVRWQIWHNKHANALNSLHRIQQLCARQKSEDKTGIEISAAMVSRRCSKLETYLTRNRSSLTNYGQRYRSGKPISSSRAEGCVDDIANARMGKRRRMRWSPRGAHRVAVTRAAILDGRLKIGQWLEAA